MVVRDGRVGVGIGGFDVCVGGFDAPEPALGGCDGGFSDSNRGGKGSDGEAAIDAVTFALLEGRVDVSSFRGRPLFLFAGSVPWAGRRAEEAWKRML